MVLTSEALRSWLAIGQRQKFMARDWSNFDPQFQLPKLPAVNQNKHRLAFNV
jgi:hypothetical protein